MPKPFTATLVLLAMLTVATTASAGPSPDPPAGYLSPEPEPVFSAVEVDNSEYSSLPQIDTTGWLIYYSWLGVGATTGVEVVGDQSLGYGLTVGYEYISAHGWGWDLTARAMLYGENTVDLEDGDPGYPGESDYDGLFLGLSYTYSLALWWSDTTVSKIKAGTDVILLGAFVELGHFSGTRYLHPNGGPDVEDDTDSLVVGAGLVPITYAMTSKVGSLEFRLEVPFRYYFENDNRTEDYSVGIFIRVTAALQLGDN